MNISNNHAIRFLEGKQRSRVQQNGKVCGPACLLRIPVHDPPSLKDLAWKLLKDGPHKKEETPRRVRGLFDGIFVFDTTEASYVWEHPYFPQFYVPFSAVQSDKLVRGEAVDPESSAFLATLKGSKKATDRVVLFEKGSLLGLVRFEFSALGEARFVRPEVAH